MAANQNIKNDIFWRVVVVYICMVVFALLIIGKAIHIQVVEKDELLRIAKIQTFRYDTIEASRGNIYAEDGSLLATSVPIFDIYMDVASEFLKDELFYQEVGNLARELSRLFGDKPASVYKRNLIAQRKKSAHYYPIRKNVTYEQLRKLREFPIFREGPFKGGFIAEQKQLRKKPYDILAERSIGYIKKSNNKSVGLENQYNEYLSGKNGRQMKVKTSAGIWMPVYNETDIEPEYGKDVYTNLNVQLQDVAEDALRRHLIQHNAEWGCAVLMEVKTGYIKAIANLTRDSLKGEYEESENKAVRELIEPGSTFKLASVLSAIEDKKIDLEDTIYIGNGTVKYPPFEIKDVHKPAKAWETVRSIFENSSNVGVSKIVYGSFKSDPKSYVTYLDRFNLNKKTGIDIPGESAPQINRPGTDSWSKVSLPFMSIGYEVKLTPLQILTFYNAIANDGKMVKPIIAREIRDGSTVIKKFDPVVISGEICSKESAKKVKELLEGVVERGSGKKAQSVYKVAGKTGTAQIADGKKGYNKRNYNASFVGYFPADNPLYSCIVVVNKPSTGMYYASLVAVPVFKEIADKVYAIHQDIANKADLFPDSLFVPYSFTGYSKDTKQICKTLNLADKTQSLKDGWISGDFSKTDVNYSPKYVDGNTIPDMKGMGAKDAVYLLERLGMEVILRGKGYIKHQSIPPGSRIKKGEQIILQLETT